MKYVLATIFLAVAASVNVVALEAVSLDDYMKAHSARTYDRPLSFEFDQSSINNRLNSRALSTSLQQPPAALVPKQKLSPNDLVNGLSIIWSGGWLLYYSQCKPCRGRLKRQSVKQSRCLARIGKVTSAGAGTLMIFMGSVMMLRSFL